MSTKRQSFANLLRICSKNRLFPQTAQIHGAISKFGFQSDQMLNNCLIDTYAKNGKLDIAYKVFDKMLNRNVVSWTSIMCGYVQTGNTTESLYLFREMGFSSIKPNEFTYSINLKACGISNDPKTGIQIHCLCLRTGFDSLHVVGNSIIDMYSKCRRINKAELMFETMPVKNVISWNTIMAGYTYSGLNDQTLFMFKKMQLCRETPDEFTLTNILKACVGVNSIQPGKQVHGFLIVNGFPCSIKETISGSLIDLYVKNANLLEARRLFDQTDGKNLVSWNALILGYAQLGDLTEVMNLFRKLRKNVSFREDSFVVSSVITVFADFLLAEQGKQMHAYIIKTSFCSDISVSNSVLNMYLKCGLIDNANKFFVEMESKNVVSYTVMITGYGKHGFGKEAVCLFEKMELYDDIEPDEVTYLAILSACSHSGLVEEAKKCFLKMVRVKPKIEHYATMVDVLGRGGYLREAKDLIEGMPLKPNVGIWQTLVSACRQYGDVGFGLEVWKKVMRLDCDNPIDYVTMSNMYVEAGFWNEGEKVREIVKRKGLRREAGRSWVG